MKSIKLIIILGITFAASLYSMHEHADADAAENALIEYDPPYCESLAQFLNTISNQLPGLPPVLHRSYIENPIALSFACLFAALADCFVGSPLLYQAQFDNSERPPFEKAQEIIALTRCNDSFNYIKRVWCDLFIASGLCIVGDGIFNTAYRGYKTHSSLKRFVKYLSEQPHLISQLPSSGKLAFIKTTLDNNIDLLAHSSPQIATELACSPFFQDQYCAQWNQKIKKLMYSKQSFPGYKQHKHNLILSCYIATFATLVYFIFFKGFICE